MIRHIVVNPHEFEQWLEKHYPEVMSEWELEASEWIELEEFMERHYYAILDEWKFYLIHGCFSAEVPAD